MSDHLERKLEGWADQASPVTVDEARLRAEAGNLVALDSGSAGDGGATGSRRLLAAAAAVVLVGAVAVGGWIVANEGDEGPTGVDTVDQPTTSIDLGPATTSNPAPTSVPTSTPGPAGTEAPNLIVVHSAEQRLEVFDRTTGATVRVLAEFDDPEAEVPDGEPAMMGRYLGSFVVSPDGQSVFYDTCCEPTVGEVFRIPVTGGEPELVTWGTDPAISPDGTKLAVVELQSLKVVDLTDGSEQRYELADAGSVALLASPSWSPDGSMLALERYDDSLDEGRVLWVTINGDQDVLSNESTVAETDADGTPTHPVFDLDGNIVVIRQTPGPDAAQAPDPTQGTRAETYDPFGDGEPIATVDLEGPVLSQQTAGGGRFILRTFAGKLSADLGDGDTLEILGHRYFDAAW